MLGVGLQRGPLLQKQQQEGFQVGELILGVVVHGAEKITRRRPASRLRVPCSARRPNSLDLRRLDVYCLAIPEKQEATRMAKERRKPGEVRDAIVSFLSKPARREASVDEIHRAVITRLGGDVARSSVRSYLNLNTPGTFTRTGRGSYRLA